MERIEYVLSEERASANTMLPLELVDAEWETFVNALPVALRACAGDLPSALGLAPAGVRWSQVFAHEVTLAAPALFAEAWPGLRPDAVRHAVRAHALAVIEAFGTDRLLDGQVAPTPTLEATLDALRGERDRSLERAGGPGGARPFSTAQAETLAAIRAEHDFFRRGEAVTFEVYERASLGKQAVGFPATMALARLAEASPRGLRAAHRALASIWLGLQVSDDAMDWEDDAARGGAWAVLLAGAPAPDARAAAVLGSGTLARMFERSRWHFGRVRRVAGVLGAHRLAGWAAEQERARAASAEGERSAPGFALRAHALRAWAVEVLS